MTEKERQLLSDAWKDVAAIVRRDAADDPARTMRALVMYFALADALDEKGYAVMVSIADWVQDWKREGATRDEIVGFQDALSATQDMLSEMMS